MSKKRQKLELTWAGKENRSNLEPRILIEDPEKSHHARHRVGDNDLFDNRLIFGDNLLALKALEQEFAGKIKCIYIDPPYNTGNAFEYYDDGLEHSTWLSMMRDRLEILRRLLSFNGFICCHIDDSEGAYLKVLMDEIFGRSNYLTTFYIQVRYPEKTLKQDMSFHKEIEQVHIYRREYGATPNLVTRVRSFDKFCYYIRETAGGREIEIKGRSVRVFDSNEYEIRKGEGGGDGLKEVWASGSILDGNSSGRFFRDYLAGRAGEDGLSVLYRVDGIGDDKFPHRYFTGPKRATATKGKYFQGVPIKLLEDDSGETLAPIENFYDLAGSFGNCRHEGGVEFRSGKKPEALLQLILTHFSNEGEIILDSFAGSGTTAAVAHKMNRRWIAVELADHCHTHILPRLESVVDGNDSTGATESSGWKGGGGFRYYRIGPSLLEKDRFGNHIISREFNPEMLAEAVCKLEGFTYSPSETEFWNHGHSTEQDFIYVTTQSLTAAQLERISEDVSDNRSLLICCGSFRVKPDRFQNLTIKKIPKAVLRKCEWGKDDYSLEIQDLPAAPEAKQEQMPPTSKAERRATQTGQGALFEEEGAAK